MRRLFINTRPRHYDDTSLKNALVALAYDYQRLPLLDIRAQSPSADEQSMQRALLAGDYQLLVVVSPIAVTMAATTLSVQHWQTLAKLSCAHLTVVAVGDATARALRAFGLCVQTPTIADNEHMAQMASVQALGAGDKALFWRGQGGRRFLFDRLSACGVQVDAIAWYERTLPTGLSDALGAFAQTLPLYDKCTVLISSQQAFRHWQQACSDCGLSTSDFDYLSLGVRLSQLLQQENLRTQPIDTLADADLLHALTCR